MMGKAGIGVIAAAAIGAGAYYAYQSTTAPQVTGGTVGMLTYSPLYAVPDYKTYLKNNFNIDLEETLDSAATLGDKLISSKGRGWDTTVFWGAFSKPVFSANPAVVQPYTKDKIPRWKDENLGRLFTDPKSVVGDVVGQQILNDMWWPGKIGQEFGALCPMYGIDTFAINPEFVDHPLQGWGDMMDRQWKGKVAMMDIPTITIDIWAMHLAKTNQIPQPGVIYNLTPPEVDQVVNWLIDQKKAGQIKAFWGDYGTSVNLMTSREVYVADIWNAAVFDARRAGVPAYYLLPNEGSIAWIGGEAVFAGVDSSKLPLIYKYLDSRLSGSWARTAGLLAYQTPAWPSQEAKNAFEAEFYDWNFLGKATYKPISEIVPGKSAWIANGLFDPQKYTWQKEPGTPSSDGNKKDRGSIETIEKSITTLETWEDRADYYVSSWNKFKQA